MTRRSWLLFVLFFSLPAHASLIFPYVPDYCAGVTHNDPKTDVMIAQIAFFLSSSLGEYEHKDPSLGQRAIDYMALSVCLDAGTGAHILKIVQAQNKPQ